MEMIFHSHVNKTHFDEKGCAIGLILKVKVFGTRKLTLKDLGRSSKMTSSGKWAIDFPFLGEGEQGDYGQRKKADGVMDPLREGRVTTHLGPPPWTTTKRVPDVWP